MYHIHIFIYLCIYVYVHGATRERRQGDYGFCDDMIRETSSLDSNNVQRNGSNLTTPVLRFRV